MKKTTWAVVVALIVGAAVGVLASRWAAQPSVPLKAASDNPPKQQAQQAKGVDVRTAPVQVVTLERQASAVGSLRSRDSAVLRPEITGRIAAINFEEGSKVEKGQVLIQLDDSIARAELEQSKANLRLARSQSQRAAQLNKEGFISRQAVDEAVNQRLVQEAAVALAQAQLDKTSILAPFDGVLGLRNVSVGDYVSPGADLVQIEAIDPLQVDFRIPEHYLGAVLPGQPLTVSFDALAGVVRNGVVDAIHPLVDVGGRSILLRATIPNPDNRLRPGLFARVRLQLSNGEAVMVPEAALAPSGETQYVFRLNDNTVERVEVQTGLRRDGMVEILAGLNEGDTVVVAGIQKISDGSRVVVDDSAATASSQSG